MKNKDYSGLKTYSIKGVIKMAKNRKAKAKRYGEKKSQEHHDALMCNLLGIKKEELPVAIAQQYAAMAKEHRETYKGFQVF